MQDWIKIIRGIPPLSPRWRDYARKKLSDQTRPAGSLGLLEEVIERLAAICEQDPLDLSKKRILIFAADHGVEAEGVSKFPREVTRAMVQNFIAGGATINALARAVRADVRVIDVGVDDDLTHEKNLIPTKVRRGSRNMVNEPAMTEKEFQLAVTAGWDAVKGSYQEGIRFIGLGEMGIANTTAASAVVAGLSGYAVHEVTGFGTGISENDRQKKIKVIESALSLHREFFDNPLSVLRCVGGLELAALFGAILACVFLKVPVVIDGWIVSASALCAIRLNPEIRHHMFFSHRSEERGHRLILEELDIKPLLSLGMRLGEASGAALAMGLIDAAAGVFNEVATFSEAHVAIAKS